MTREFDLIIWGATGFTGRLVAEYIFQQYGVDQDLKWAMAGRNLDKLQTVRSKVANEQVPLLVADSNDDASLHELVKRTKVLCTTVGPYAKFGSKLVAACVSQQTDYCDLTGEVQWMRKMIDQHHKQAEANGTRIVHTCGFDSIPSDMGVYFFQKVLFEQFGAYCPHLKLRVKAIKGAMSGGTYASMSHILVEAESDRSVFKTLFHPYGLNPIGQQEGLDEPDLQSVVYDEDAKAWICPFIMATINTKVVRRSHALRGFPYGKNFRYEEAMMTGSGLSGRMKGYAALAATGLMMSAKPDSLLKKGIDYLLPAPGEGPSLEQRENGFFNMSLLGKMSDGTLIKGKVTGDRDPGYGSTCKMLGESAVCLAKDQALTPKVAGVLTPSVAMGDALLKRLRANAGLRFEIDL